MNVKIRKMSILITIILVSIIFLKPTNVFAEGETCPSGYVLTGTVCTRTEDASCRSGSCWCPPGSDAKLQGDKCVYTVNPEGGTNEDAPSEGETCEDGYEWINGTCMKYLGPASQREGAYYCLDGTLVNSACYSYYVAEENEEQVEEPSTPSEENTSKPSADLDNICSDKGVMKTMRILGYIIMICKWIAPLIIIVLGMLDFGKAIVSNDDQALNKATASLIRRIIVGLTIFLIPTIIMALLNITVKTDIDSDGKTIIKHKLKDTDFGTCTKCLFNIDECVVDTNN